MRQSAATLEAFYASRVGRAAAGLIARRVAALWQDCRGDSLLGIGYTLPLMSLWDAHTTISIAALPETIGAPNSLTMAPGRVVRAPEHRLPFADGSFNRILILHGLEEATNPQQLMREAWRLLAPEGRIIVAATNRRSLWSINEAQAFGHGRPWTRSQLIHFLTDSLFQVTASATAVHMPPLDWPVITGAAEIWERVGDIALPGIGGVVLIEAIKRLYAEPGGTAGAAVTQAVKAGRPEPGLPKCEAAPDGSPGLLKKPLTCAGLCAPLRQTKQERGLKE